MASESAPSVAVVVAAYQGEAFIERCLASLVAQEGEALEVVVVDDGSTDATAERAAAFPVTVVATEHGGVAAARNAGLRAARAPYVGFCDQDDEWLPTKAARQRAHLEQRPDLAGVLCRQRWVLAGGTRPPWLVPDANGDLGGVAPLSGLFRADALRAVGGFEEGLDGRDDIDLLVRLREHGLDVEVLDDVLLVRHAHDANASHDLESYASGLHDVVRRHRRRVQA